MAATATFKMLYCVQAATGTDFGAIQALAGIPEKLDLASFDGDLIRGVAAAIPDVVAALDSAGDDPDELFVTTSTEGELENAIWPEPDGAGEQTPVPIRAGQSVTPFVEIEVRFSQNVSLWEADLGFLSSDNDLLGSITILESEQDEGDIAKVASSTVERSVDFVSYSVD
jgi:hypothetical protein